MACGKGGDLTKYRRNAEIKYYVGVDIAEVSVEHAKERFSGGRFPFDAEFFSGDAFGQPLSSIIKKQVRVNLVSCQFALHYAFKTEEMCRQAIENISQSLMRDGIFICTVPNAKIIMKRASQGKAHNAHYRIKFKSDLASNDILYGQEYTFWLTDAIEDCPEYLIDVDNFVKVCGDHDLVLVESHNFKDMYLKYGPEYHDLLKVMGVLQESTTGSNKNSNNRLNMTREEMEIAELYDAYMFCKK
jgi:mRNA (guanine-N7-)-methyltransferase